MTSLELGGLAGLRRGRHLESMTSYQKSDSVNRCVFTGETILSNFILIVFQTTESWAVFVDRPPTRRRTTIRTR